VTVVCCDYTAFGTTIKILYSFWNNNKDILLFTFFWGHLNLEPRAQKTTPLWNPQNSHFTVWFWAVRKFPDEYEVSQMSALVLSSVTSWQYLQYINQLHCHGTGEQDSAVLTACYVCLFLHFV